MLLDDDVPRLTSATPPAQITIQRSAGILHVTALRVHAAFFRDLPFAVFQLWAKVFDCWAFLWWAL